MKMTQEESAWFANHDNVVALGAWLVDQAILVTAEDVIRYFEKPWKWAHERIHMLVGTGEAGKLPKQDGCVLCDEMDCVTRE